MISFSGRILNQVQAPAISREQSSLRRNTRAWEWVCALFCLIAMAGCAGLVSQNLPAPSGQLSATPGSVDFGSVEVGVSSTQSITFNNMGSGSLTISQAAVSGAGFTLVGQTFPSRFRPVNPAALIYSSRQRIPAARLGVSRCSVALLLWRPVSPSKARACGINFRSRPAAWASGMWRWEPPMPRRLL